MFQHLLWHLPSLVPLAVALSLLIVTAVVGIHWTQMRSMSGLSRWLIPSLRGVALVVVAISIIRPVIVRPRTPAERGAIVLLVDRSRSMGVVDRGRTASQLVALADGLQMLPAGIRPKSSADLANAPDALRLIVNDMFLARGQLDYARIAGQSTDDAQQRLADISKRAQKLADILLDYQRASQEAQKLVELSTDTDTPADEWADDVNAVNDSLAKAIADAQTAADNDLYRSNDLVRSACDQLGGMSRLEIVGQALLSPQNAVLKKLLRQAPVFGFAYADNVSPLPLEDKLGPVKTLAMDVGGLHSDLRGALRTVRENMQNQPVQAIVLFSDGQQNGGGGGDLSQVLASIGAPIFPVFCAGPVHKDLAITRLQAPASTYIGQAAIIRATIRGVGFAGAPVDVVLNADNKRLTQQVTVADDRAATAEFAVAFDHPGDQTIDISIPPHTGETTTQNNHFEKPIKVLADKINVLAVTGWPGWDFQYFQAALGKSPFVDLKAQILSQAQSKLAVAPEQIERQDVVLLSDVSGDALSPQQWAALQKLITDRGGSVIVIPGDPKNLSDIAHQSGVENLLPFRNVENATWRVWPGEDPYFQLSVAAGEENSDALRLGDDPAESARRWSNLPGMFRFMPVADAKPGVRPLLIERDSELPALTESHAGAGRCFFFGARETWRWRAVDGGAEQERFWLQLIRYAARSRASSSAEAEITEEPLIELANVAGDPNRLSRIAATSGGDMLQIEDVDTLPGKVATVGEKLPGFFEYPIWDSGYLFAFVIGCFGFEWALRKRAGLL